MLRRHAFTGAVIRVTALARADERVPISERSNAAMRAPLRIRNSRRVQGIAALTSVPDCVSALPVHGPAVPASGVSAEQDSALSFNDQLAQLI